jgi:DNA polymerase III delta prime subunit
METNNILLIQKYQPVLLVDYEMDPNQLELINTFIKMDNINLLLNGDVASGKTTLLKTIIGEYYTGYSYCEYKNNILYINNLKDQGISYYRTDVKTFCQTNSLIKNKKKIVVLDDIDLINEQSQQVFRHFIDNFSNRVHFISSCINIQKVSENVQSRINVINLQPIELHHLKRIADKIIKCENIHINQDAYDFIVNISNKNINNLINYFEKITLLHNEEITLDIVHKLCFTISLNTFVKYTTMIINNQPDEAISLIYSIYDQGYSVIDILDNYFTFIKQTNLLTEEQKYKIIPYICKYIEIFYNIHEDVIELALFTFNLVCAL